MWERVIIAHAGSIARQEIKSGYAPAQPMGKPLIYCHLSKYFAGSPRPDAFGRAIFDDKVI